MTDLSLIRTEDMLNELQKRFDLFIFAGTKIRTQNQLSTLVKFNPINYSTLGLSNILRKRIEQNVDAAGWQPGFDQDKI